MENLKKGFTKIRQEKYDKNPEKYGFHIQIFYEVFMICKYCESKNIELVVEKSRFRQYFCHECETFFSVKENK